MQINEKVEDGKIIILDFYAEWCGPCKTLMPVLEEIQSENKNIELVKINIESEMDTAREYGVRSVPTIYIISSKGKKNMVGFNSKEKIMHEISTLL